MARPVPKTQKYFSSGCRKESNQAWWPFTITKLMAPHFSWHTQSHYVPLANSKLFHILGVNVFLVWYSVLSMIHTNLLKSCFLAALAALYPPRWLTEWLTHWLTVLIKKPCRPYQTIHINTKPTDLDNMFWISTKFLDLDQISE